MPSDRKRKMETSEPSETAGGNTIPPRAVPGKYWCFTWHDYPEGWMETLSTDLKGCKYCIGAEICPETKRPHLQGYVEFPIKVRPIERLGWPKVVSWRKAKGSRDDNVRYNTKEGGDLLCNVPVPPPKIKWAEPPPIKIWGWQVDLYERLKLEPDERSIFWVWSEEGGCGKSSLAKFLVRHSGLNTVVVSGKTADMKHTLATYVDKNRGENVQVVICDVPRSCSGFISYAGLEEIKNGLFCSSKYESRMIDLPLLHVVVLANIAPDKDNIDLSSDRIVEINLNGLNEP